METRRRDRPRSGPTAANGSEAVTSAVIWSTRIRAKRSL
jgi:hypothetical protein